MGRLIYIPSTADRALVRERAITGTSPEDIAAELNLPLKKVQKLFRYELQQGDLEGKREVLSKMYETAKSGSNITAMIFWLKARCGWSDTGLSHKKPATKLPPFIVKSK